ncbi:hypothetical protein [Rubellicoccus peritrichatus]|uniref:Uncharacterized protein n=1 Tax=Rubellicoccus peritrichatus TaxID=3080537 RepID=A0AAQ3L935_9BACT|nr:hypothetical protein [Puniceicoccus sp. CR14]WOO41615.1 hypothetical protein RZN69_00845 [Puniceicoccus sp. CR14]
MRTISHISIILAILLTAAAAQADTIVKSFENDADFDYDYSSWGNAETPSQTTPTKDGIEIGGTATNEGGAGSKVSLDLSKESYIDVTAMTLPGNTGKKFNVILFTAGGGSSGYQFDLTDFDRPSFTTMSKSLTDPTFVDRTNGAVDLSDVTSVQVQGDYGKTVDAIKMKLKEIKATH